MNAWTNRTTYLQGESIPSQPVNLIHITKLRANMSTVTVMYEVFSLGGSAFA
jgi:hypothetical protein